MHQKHFDPGIYTNVFPIELPDKPLTIMTITRKQFPDLRPLREKVCTSGWSVRVYAAGSLVYGYGTDMHKLKENAFSEQQIAFAKHPQFSSRLITEGFVDMVEAEGFLLGYGRGRQSVYQPNPLGTVANGKVRVHLGYDLRTIYWGTESARYFGLVVDISWTFRDDQGHPLNMHRIAEYGAAIQVAQIQAEFLPGGTRINTEVAQQRLQQQIIPFLEAHCEFVLPVGERANLIVEPIRVVLGGGER